MNNKLRIHSILFIESIVLEIHYRIIQKIGSKKHKIEVDAVNNSFKELNSKAKIYYQSLISKYPEFIWAEKYIEANLSLSVHPIIAMFVLDTQSIHSLLTTEATINDIVMLLFMGFSVTTDIMTHKGTPHTIVISSFSKIRKEFYFKDPLGNYNLRYKVTAHSYCYISYEKLLKISLGKPISITTMNKDKQVLLFIKNKLFRNKKYYIF